MRLYSFVIFLIFLWSALNLSLTVELQMINLNRILQDFYSKVEKNMKCFRCLLQCFSRQLQISWSLFGKRKKLRVRNVWFEGDDGHERRVGGGGGGVEVVVGRSGHRQGTPAHARPRHQPGMYGIVFWFWLNLQLKSGIDLGITLTSFVKIMFTNQYCPTCVQKYAISAQISPNLSMIVRS